MKSRYKKSKVGGKTFLTHRLVMEAHLGRKLTLREHVHHKNEDRFDNRLENLEVLDAKAHSAHHNQKHPITKRCEYCGTEFTPHPTKRLRAKTCSEQCRRILAGRKKRALSEEQRNCIRSQAQCRGGRRRGEEHMMHTFGYQGQSREALIAWLLAHDAILVDIRYAPASANPIWRWQSLRKALPGRYFECRLLGNRNHRDRSAGIEIADLEGGIHLLELEYKPLVLLCTCRAYTTCHRRIVAEALRQRGQRVEELVL